MKRSKFLALSAITVASLAVPALKCSAPDAALDKKLSIPQILSSLVDENTLIKIGRAYTTMKTEHASLFSLEKLLVKDSDGKVWAGNSPASEIAAFLEKKILNDYESGNTAVLNGWVLSDTEAQQCALFSLLATTK
jgi:hypothetical protein